MLGRLPARRIARRVAHSLGASEEAPPRKTLHPADGRVGACEHLQAACRALAGGGLTHAEVFRELRLLVNRLEAGGLPAPELAIFSPVPEERAPQPRFRPRLRRVFAAALAGRAGGGG